MYFDVSEDKILERLAIPAANLGIPLVVLDDGWFGKRDNDRSSLVRGSRAVRSIVRALSPDRSPCALSLCTGEQGDWYPDLAKFPNGLKGVADRVNALGLEFGIWMEPEMISVDSELYRANPEWPLHVGNRPRTESRNQLVLGSAWASARSGPARWRALSTGAGGRGAGAGAAHV